MPNVKNLGVYYCSIEASLLNANPNQSKLAKIKPRLYQPLAFNSTHLLKKLAVASPS